jgi:lysophospholipase L1-like esterase
MRPLLLLFLTLTLGAQTGFQLKPGDRVVFYGDSITAQRLYTTWVETYVRTRFPDLNVTFVHSGWGGDRVTGGGGGTIDTRVERDIAAYKPTVITIMLGMNDGRYTPLNKELQDWYATGFTAMIEKIKKAAPGARITLIRPSPYDEVTRAPIAGGGYNPVLIKFGDFLQQMATKEGFQIADLNAPVVKMLEKAKATDAETAGKIIPDRVHPSAAGHLIMAEALLQTWGAPGAVSEVEIDAGIKRIVRQDNTAVTELKFNGGISWTQADRALPVPVDPSDATLMLAVKSAGFTQAMNRETLKIDGLESGFYALRIDGLQTGVFTGTQLGAGLDLSTLPTPMARQAAEVHRLTLRRTGVHNFRFMDVEAGLAKDKFSSTNGAVQALDALDTEIDQRQRAAAQPTAHRYELVPVPAETASVPYGFTPIFNGKDLAGWHVSKTNHHGTTPDWKVEQGVLTGMQNPVGQGGILLTDKRYKNVEVYAEIMPDWGCDGGLFLRSSEKGEAYQVMLDYREKGTLFGVYGEALKDVAGHSVDDWRKHWKENEWNAVKARIEGDIPRITVWINGVQVTNWSDTSNHGVDGAADGMIAVQVHGGTQIWKEGGRQRFRNVAVRELP